MGQEVSIPIAFGAGFLSFFSPCILPLIPIYIMYLTGTTAESEVKKLFALWRTFGFILGFTTIFMIMGLSATFIGQAFAKNRAILFDISGYVMIIFGISMLGIIKLKFLKLPQFIKSPKEVTSFFSAFVMGLAFALGWSPCFGPVLASIIFYAGATATATQGAFLLLIYSLGMAVPFILTALFIGTFNKFLAKFDKYGHIVPKVSGVMLIIFGILILTNSLQKLSLIFL
jgi:cytochrome c-type biogenesis protein